MTNFDKLSRNEQIERLRQLVEIVLPCHYALRVRGIELLDGCNNNAVFCVSGILDGEKRVKKFAFRMPRRNEYCTAAVESEARWLSAVCRDTDLVVPEPVPGRDGKLVFAVEIPGFAITRQCVLFHWVEGEFIRERDLTSAHLRKVGEFTARLHEHAAIFARSQHIHRGRCDRGWLPTLLIEQLKHAPSLCTENQRRILAEATEKIIKDFYKLDETNAEILLIHGDLNQSNYLFHDGEVGAIDFEHCGFSHPMFDLGSTIRHIENREDLPILHDALLNGYAKVRPLPDNAEKQVEMFELIRWLKTVSWEFLQSDFEQNIYAIRRVQNAVKRCERYLQS